jgi:hypothetical protein
MSRHNLYVMKKTKKPKILKEKIELANLVLSKCERLSFSKHPTGPYWWRGVFIVDEYHIYVYFQMYVNLRKGVDYVHIRNEKTGQALTVKEIKKLLYSLKYEESKV